MSSHFALHCTMLHSNKPDVRPPVQPTDYSIRCWCLAYCKLAKFSYYKDFVAQFHCMEMNWSSLLALVLLTYFVVSMLFTGVFLLLTVRNVHCPPHPFMEGLHSQQPHF